MTLAVLEQRLKAINPAFHVKKYGTSMAAVHKGTEHLFRVPQGEITLYSVTEPRIGHSESAVTPQNPDGAYEYDYKLRRGVGELAHLLHLGGQITGQQAAFLRSASETRQGGGKC